MRLTPSWLRSSSDDSPEERSENSDTTSGVTIYHAPPNTVQEGDPKDTQRAANFIPESDTELLAALDEVGTPTTVDEVTDQLLHPARPPIDTWASVHERLHQDRLPELDASGDIEFDTNDGLVEYQTSYARTESRFSLASLRRIWAKVLYTLIALIAAVLLIGVIAAVAATTFDISVFQAFI